MSFGRYQFLSWARRGVARSITERDTLGKRTSAATERARIPLSVELTTGDSISQTFALMGPGDITGVNRSSIIRTEPLNGTGDFEPNYLPCVEFYDEDFPFRYTPASPAGNDLHLRPWLALVVLKIDEFVETARRDPLPSIQVINNDVLPPHDELHLWCHMHSNLPHEESEFDAFLDGLEADVKKDPDGIYSRLICPRKLEAKAQYHAFLIPTFETGRRAGLGQKVAGVPAQQSAWTGEATEYPVYFQFEFRTGKNFDFEYLVKQLRPRVMDRRVGIREMDCSRPGFIRADVDAEVSAPNPPVLMLEGAVMAPDAQRSAFPSASLPQPYFDDIEKLVNLNRTQVQSDDKDPTISVPFYGMYHALRRDPNAPGKRDVPTFNPNDTRNWYNDLNRDPRTRVPAGFGKRVVQENQEQFANQAWLQLGDVLEANRRIRESRFAAVIMQQLYLSTFAAQEAPRYLAMTRAMSSRVLGASGTIQKEIQESRVSSTVFTGAFTRMTRSTTSIAKGLAQRSRANGFDLKEALPKMNRRNGIRPDVDGNFKPVSAMRNVTEFTAPSTASKVKVWSAQSNLSDDFAMNQDGFTGGLPPMADWVKRFDPEQFKFDSGIAAAGVDGAAGQLPGALGGRVHTPPNGGVLGPRPTLTGAAARRTTTLAAHPGFSVLTEARDIRFVNTTVASNKLAVATHNKEVRTAYKNLNVRLAFDAPNTRAPALATDAVVDQLDRAIAPRFSYKKRLTQLLKWPEGTFRPQPEAFLPAIAYPDFPAATYQYLVDIDKEFLLPNLELIENNTLSLLKTNQKFIESYLVGMNYEMGRELMWREYPTDMRGSYFRQFWDVSGFVTPDTTPRDAQALKDIEPIHNWPRRSLLGSHNARDAEGDDEQLVFVLRGDLLRKFPNTVIFAQKAILNQDPDSEAETAIRTGEMSVAQIAAEIRFPLYQAQIDPDIKLLGFDLTIKEASGDGQNDLGWYFILAEVPGEPRFGMDISFEPNVDDALTWNDLAWANLPDDTKFITSRRKPSARTRGGRTALFPVDPDIGRWGKSSADMAAILLQRPAMIAIHASEMLNQSTPSVVDTLVTTTLASHLTDIGFL